MKDSRRNQAVRGEQGFALVAVILFAFIVFLLASSFYAMAFYEGRGAIYQQSSTEAFSLADGAIERARGEFLGDISWRGPVTGQPAGSGAYDLTLTDSTWTDGRDAVFLQARGHVQGADRGVDAWIELRNPIELGIMIVNRDIDANGNFCIDGHIHVNGDVDINNPSCDGIVSNFCCIEPIKMYTEPSKFPGATYYYVYGVDVPATPADSAIVTDGAGNPVTGISLLGLTEYDIGSNRFTYDFTKKINGDYAATKYFGEGGEFAKNPMDVSVVVNFGETLIPGAVSNIDIKQKVDDPDIRTTIITSRFIGASEDQRTDPNFWTGGLTTLATGAEFSPWNGIALVTHDLDASNAQVTVGTPTNPGLLYVTRDVDDVQGDFAVNGAVVVLRDWISQGGPEIVFNAGFLALLPEPFLISFTSGGQTGIMALLDWREVALEP